MYTHPISCFRADDLFPCNEDGTNITPDIDQIRRELIPALGQIASIADLVVFPAEEVEDVEWDDGSGDGFTGWAIVATCNVTKLDGTVQAVRIVY